LDICKINWFLPLFLWVFKDYRVIAQQFNLSFLRTVRIVNYIDHKSITEPGDNPMNTIYNK
ncbi:hypothetical protein, partial [Escherichia coli]|uniref:hypothetical protein n=1 Tax=Escherichia coli TaxID=562 RepID=UPI001ABCC3DA